MHMFMCMVQMNLRHVRSAAPLYLTSSMVSSVVMKGKRQKKEHQITCIKKLVILCGEIHGGRKTYLNNEHALLLCRFTQGVVET